MTPARHGLAAVLATLVVLLGTGLALAGGAAAEETPSPLPTPTGPPEPDAPFTVDDASFTWGLNNESNNKAFAPGTINFLSAGAVPDPGRGGQSVVAPGVWRGTDTRAWRSRAGSVQLQKQLPSGAWRSASFGGLSTDAGGSALTSTTGPFSGHRIVLSGGSGTVDPAAGTARIDWTGSFSVVYYSGFSFFTVTDPTLVVADGVGQLRATLAGYAADRVDPEKWGPVPAQRVVLADLPGVDLPAEGGFSAQPAYVGVRYDGGSQVRDCASCGAFPVSFLRYMERAGSSAFWYSSGGSADPHKVPLPIAVAYDAGTAAEPTDPPTEQPTEPTGAPTGSPTATPDPTTTVNPTPPGPTPPDPAPSDPVPGSPVVPVQPPGPSLPVQPGATTAPLFPPSGVAAVAAPGVVAAPRPDTVYALSSAEAAAPGSPPSSSTWPWWLGSALLLGAASLTVLTLRSRPSRGSS